MMFRCKQISNHNLINKQSVAKVDTVHEVKKLDGTPTSIMNFRGTLVFSYDFIYQAPGSVPRKKKGTWKWNQCIKKLVHQRHMLLFVLWHSDQAWCQVTWCIRCLSCQYTTIQDECTVDAKVVSWMCFFKHVHHIIAMNPYSSVCHKFEI